MTDPSGIARSEIGTFLIKRWDELLDSSVSASFCAYLKLSVPVALQEVCEAAIDFQQNNQYSDAPFLDALRDALQIVKEDRIAEKFIKPQYVAWRDVVESIDRDVKNKGKKSLRSVLHSRFGELRIATDELKRIVDDRYDEEAIRDLNRSIEPHEFQYRDLMRIDKSLTRIASLLLSKGHVAEQLRGIFENGDSDFRSPEVVVSIIEEKVRAVKSLFVVAVVIDGASKIVNVEAEGWIPLLNGGVKRWGHSSSDEANLKLSEFYDEHVKCDTSQEGSILPRRTHLVLLKNVFALDSEHARLIGLGEADKLVDRLWANHRTRDFGVKRKCLVLDVETGCVSALSGKWRPGGRAHMIEARTASAIDRSLRFATMSAVSRSALVQLLFGWISLETAMVGCSGKTQQFIVGKVPKVFALSCDNAIYHHSWNVAISQFLEAGCGDLRLSYLLSKGLKSKHKGSGLRCGRVAFVNIFSILNASDYDLIEVAESARLHIHARYRLWLAKRLSVNPDTRREYLRRCEQDARIALNRIRRFRNKTAHTQYDEELSLSALSLTLSSLIDSVFENSRMIKRGKFWAVVGDRADFFDQQLNAMSNPGNGVPEFRYKVGKNKQPAKHP